MLTHDEFDKILSNRRSLVIDGALATELETRGLDLSHALWSAKILQEDPDAIRKVHLDYFLAGADIAITASYQANIQGFCDHLSIQSAEATTLIESSVTLAQEARDRAYQHGASSGRKLLVAGSVGPYGAFLADGSEYRGDYSRTKTEFQSFHRPRIQALVDSGVDLLAIETMPNIHEIIAVLEMLSEDFPNTIGWLSCTIRDARHISDGTPIEKVAGLANRYRDQIVAMGVNCIPANVASDALVKFKSHTDLPLVCYPNSGGSWNAEDKTWSGGENGPVDLSSSFPDWQTKGARLIGGCCRTGPEYIKLITRTVA